MPLTRTHIAFLGIISIFTGIIAPGVQSGTEPLSYLMLDIRALAYAVLIALIIAFFTSALRQWRLYRICIAIIITTIGVLGVWTLFFPLETVRTGSIVTGMSWGWIFLIAGVILLSMSYRDRDTIIEESTFSDAIDTVIGMVGGSALACIAGILILSSLSLMSPRDDHAILDMVYGTGETETLSGGIRMSRAAYDTVPDIAYDRGADILSITTLSGGVRSYITYDGMSIASGRLMDRERLEIEERRLVRSMMTGGVSKSDVIHPVSVTDGTDTLTVSGEKGLKKVLYNDMRISRDLAEVREMFVEKDGSSYAYFGRPVGEHHYCLFTRYRGNICGLAAYMNPILGADGGSIIFAGKKDGTWSLYRNTDTIVKNIPYSPVDISYDYAYYDSTNPRTYLIIMRDPTTYTYTYLKNGKILPGVWIDVSTDVYFGYDNHIITSAKDETGWRVVEL